MRSMQEERGEGVDMQGRDREHIRMAWMISLRILAFSPRGRQFEEFQAEK